SLFLESGFTLHDDVLSFDRTDHVPPWQHSSIAEVEFRYRGDEVFGFKTGFWDLVTLQYLFASLPIEFATTFAEIVEKVALKLDLSAEYRGATADKLMLQNAFQEHYEEVLSETGDEPGSESLAIFIQSTYPRSPH